MTEGPQRFICTSRGAIAAGRCRLRRLLGMLGLVGIAVAVLAAWGDRAVPAALAVGAGLLALFARRMSADLDPVWLEIDGDRLVVQMRRRHERIALAGTTVRRLERDDIDHLTRLATTAGVTAGTGGFDSHRLGELDLYASDMERAVLIDRGETSVVVTPDEPERFIESVVAAGAVGQQ